MSTITRDQKVYFVSRDANDSDGSNLLSCDVSLAATRFLVQGTTITLAGVSGKIFFTSAKHSSSAFSAQLPSLPTRDCAFGSSTDSWKEGPIY